MQVTLIKRLKSNIVETMLYIKLKSTEFFATLLIMQNKFNCKPVPKQKK